MLWKVGVSWGRGRGRLELATSAYQQVRLRFEWETPGYSHLLFIQQTHSERSSSPLAPIGNRQVPFLVQETDKYLEDPKCAKAMREMISKDLGEV